MTTFRDTQLLLSGMALFASGAFTTRRFCPDRPTHEVFIRGLGWTLSRGIDQLAYERQGTLINWYDVSSVMRRLRADGRPVSIVGHSFGADAAIELASELPVQALVLWDPTKPATAAAQRGHCLLSSNFQDHATTGLDLHILPHLGHIEMALDPFVLELTKAVLDG